MDRYYDYAILGAGCAGLSLAWYLLKAEFQGSIVILDQKKEFTNDRTWCFWDVDQTDFSDLASHRWPRWQVIQSDGMRSPAHQVSYRYLHLQSMPFYQRILERVRESQQVTLLLGNSVISYETNSSGVKVKTTGGDFLVTRVFDSVGHLERKTSRQTQKSPFEQHFFGTLIKTVDPIFDTSCVTLMDFRTGQSQGPHFIYILPFSPTEALVENTYLMPCVISEARHKQEIADYLRTNYGLMSEAYKIEAEEQGRIPMNANLPQSDANDGVVRIGLAGGAARPSSGYAFLRIQRHCQWLAKKLTNQATAKASPLESRRYKFLDRVFLQAILDQPDKADRLFHQLFSDAPTDELLRFMSDCGTLRDDLRVMRSLPVKPFLLALAHLKTKRPNEAASL